MFLLVTKLYIYIYTKSTNHLKTHKLWGASTLPPIPVDSCLPGGQQQKRPRPGRWHVTTWPTEPAIQQNQQTRRTVPRGLAVVSFGWSSSAIQKSCFAVILSGDFTPMREFAPWKVATWGMVVPPFKSPGRCMMVIYDHPLVMKQLDLRLLSWWPSLPLAHKNWRLEDWRESVSTLETECGVHSAHTCHTPLKTGRAFAPFNCCSGVGQLSAHLSGNCLPSSANQGCKPPAFWKFASPLYIRL